MLADAGAVEAVESALAWSRKRARARAANGNAEALTRHLDGVSGALVGGIEIETAVVINRRGGPTSRLGNERRAPQRGAFLRN